MALAPGHSVGRYEILAVLGQGGFGITYRARDTQLDREVALKEYLPAALAVRQDGASVLPRSTEVAEDFGWGRERFIEEGRTLATLHEAPSIVQVFDFLEENGTAYIVMELLRGETLEERIKAEGPLSPAELEAILWPLIEGLRKVHETGFLHRDIKPANVLLGEGNRPTLIDFGASRAAMADRTQTMTAIFTPGYAAPEQFASAKQGPWTDIYGLAATLYHAITGKAPPNAFDRLMEDTYQPLATLQPPGFARGLLAGIDAGLSVHVEERPQNLAEWRALLGERPVESEATVVMACASRASDPAHASNPADASQHADPACRRAAGSGTGQMDCACRCRPADDWCGRLLSSDPADRDDNGSGCARAAAGGCSARRGIARGDAGDLSTGTPTASGVAAAHRNRRCQPIRARRTAVSRDRGGGASSGNNRSPTAAGRADRARLRHSRVGRRSGPTLARNDRGLAKSAKSPGDGLCHRRREPGPAAGSAAGAATLRGGQKEARGAFSAPTRQRAASRAAHRILSMRRLTLWA